MNLIIRRTIIIFLIFCSLGLYSQRQGNAVISLDRIKILYKGIDNPISVAIPNISNDKIKVSINNGIISGTNGKYIVKVDTGKIAIIEITAEIKPGKFEQVGIDTFEIYKTPNPSICIGSFCSFGYEYHCIGSEYNSSILIPKDELIKNDEINVTYDSPINYKLHLESFTFSCTYLNGIDTSFYVQKIEGNKFSTEILNRIKSMTIGTKIILSEIKVLTPNGNLGRLNSITITLIGEDK